MHERADVERDDVVRGGRRPPVAAVGQRRTSTVGDLQRTVGNRVTSTILQRVVDEGERFGRTQASVQHSRDPAISSRRNHLVDLYEKVSSTPPETYLGNVYPELLPRGSAMVSNLSSAATTTADHPVDNRARWCLQTALAEYALQNGYDTMVERARSSTEFSRQMHETCFRFAGGASTIGSIPWAVLTMIDVPVAEAHLRAAMAAPGAFFAALSAGMDVLARDPMATAAANAAFDTTYGRLTAVQSSPGSTIAVTINTLNSPRGLSSLPWYGLGLRLLIDAASAVATPLFD